MKFDIHQLCGVAATVGSASNVTTIEKMEGGFCKALLMKKADGTEIVAKIPTKLAGSPRFTTASKVSTLKYGNSHLEQLILTFLLM